MEAYTFCYTHWAWTC